MRKIREKLYIKRNIYLPVEVIIEKIKEIRHKGDTIAICPESTNGNWLGVKMATLGLFPENTLIFPQYYSSPIYSIKELKIIAEELINNKFRNIIFSGFVEYFETFIELLNHKISNSKIGVIYHGSLATNSEDKKTTHLFSNLLSLCEDGKIQKLGFIKKGMRETFYKLKNLNTFHLLLFTRKLDILPAAKEKGFISIGIFSHDLYRKNIHNQVAAALMTVNSRVFLRQNYGFDYLGNIDRIKTIGFNRSYEDYISLLMTMDLNLYVSFSECWGQVITESLAYGIPCLAANNSGIFDYDKELHDSLIVNEFDDSNEIHKKIEEILIKLNYYSTKGPAYVKKLNDIAQENLITFVND